MRPLLTRATATIRRPSSQPWGPVVAVAAVAALPILVHALRAAWGDWVPAGDDAYFTVRSRDVGTVHHPLLGAWSSGSLDLEQPINNLGPIQLDLMAPFTKIAPMGGTAIAVALSNIAAIAGIALSIARIAGRRAVVAAMVPVALLTWTLGSEMLITPRQHQYLVLPYLCFLVAAWAFAAGDRWSLLPAVAAGSLAVQTHLSYPVLVGSVGVSAIGWHLVTTRRREAFGGRLPVTAAVALAAVLWVQTLVDQVAGLHNLGHVLFGSAGTGAPGPVTGARLIAGVLLSTTTLLRPGYQRDDTDALMAGDVRLALFVAMLLVAVAVAALAMRRGHRRAAVGIGTAVVAVTAGIADAALLPRTVFGLAIMNYRWLWSTGAFVLIVVAVSVAVWSEREPRLRRATSWAAALAVAALAVANLPTSVQHREAARYLEEQAAVASALDQLDRAGLGDVDGAVLIDESEMYFGHPFTYPVLVALQEDGVPFRFESPLQERRFGARRVADGTERHRLRMISGDPAIALAGDSRTLAYVPGSRPVVFLLEPIGS